MWLDRLGPAEADVAETVADILSDVERARTLVESVRRWFTGSAQDRVAVDLSMTLRSVLARTAADGPGGVPTVSAHLDEGLRIDADPVLLDHALRNLVSNAMAAARRVPAADGTVVVTARRDGARAVVAVSDSGPGFAPEALTRATQPFFTMGTGGLGVGLAIVHWFAETHGGQLVVVNEERGACVQMSLALAAECVPIGA